jgi:uncharacterized repeat protein (TIGR01451 family)
MGFRDGVGMVMDYFNVSEDFGGDGVDLVDTLEVETIAKLGIFTMTYDENDLGTDFTLKKDNYVRALGVVSWHIYKNIMGSIVDAYFNFTWKFYRGHVNSTGYMDIKILDDTMIVDMWLAIDHQNASTPMDYRDATGGIGIINGFNDEIVDAPFTQGWWEVSSPHGGYVCVWNMDLEREISAVLFDDDMKAEDHDNAEPGLFGRTGGIFFNLAHFQLSYGNISIYPLASNVDNVAEGICQNVTFPLMITPAVQHSPTIWVDKEVDKEFAGPGEMVTYTIHLNNTGDETSPSIWINDTLPSDVTFSSHDADVSSTTSSYFVGFSRIGQDLFFEFSAIPPGEHSFQIVVTVNGGVGEGLIVTNWVYCNFLNQNMRSMPESSASASFETLGVSYPNVQMEKVVDKIFAQAGEDLQYTIFFNNLGGVAAETVWINDTLPPEVTYVSDSSASEGGVKTGDHNWTFSNVSPGLHSFVINVTLNPGANGTIVRNFVHMNYTAAGGVDMPGSSDWANMTLITRMVLKPGWNFISIPYIQSESDILDVLSSIEGSYNAVQWYDCTDSKKHWKHNKKGKPFGNDLSHLTEKKGFWIHITGPGDAYFSYKGVPPSVNQSIQIHKGWNQVGFPSLASKVRTVGLNNLIFDTEIDCIWWYNATAATWHSMDLGDEFVPGIGYWIHSKVDKVWDVPL